MSLRRRWEVWALYTNPKLVQRCWTRRGAEAARQEWRWRTWSIDGLAYEVRRR